MKIQVIFVAVLVVVLGSVSANPLPCDNDLAIGLVKNVGDIVEDVTSGLLDLLTDAFDVVDDRFGEIALLLNVGVIGPFEAAVAALELLLLGVVESLELGNLTENDLKNIVKAIGSALQETLDEGQSLVENVSGPLTTVLEGLTNEIDALICNAVSIVGSTLGELLSG